MEKIIEFLLRNSFGNILDESSGYLRAKGLVAAVQVLEGWRKLTLLYFSLLLAFVIFVACLFSAVFYNTTALEVRLDLLNSIFLTLSFCSIFYLTWALREKRWIRMFKLDEKIYSLKERENSAVLRQNESLTSDPDIEKEISRIVDDRVRYYLESQKENPRELLQ